MNIYQNIILVSLKQLQVLKKVEYLLICRGSTYYKNIYNFIFFDNYRLVYYIRSLLYLIIDMAGLCIWGNLILAKD